MTAYKIYSACIATILAAIILINPVSAAEASSRRHALIIGAKAGQNTLELDNIKFTARLITYLKERYQLKSEDISVLFNNHQQCPFSASEATKKNILGEFDRLQTKCKPGSELWIFLIGYASANTKGYSLVTSAGRLRSADFSKILSANPARKYLFCFTTAGGVLLNNLRAIKNLSAISATNSAGENTPPRLPYFFMDECKNNNNSSLFAVINDAVIKLRQYYTSHSMLIPESAMLLAGGKISPLPLTLPEQEQTIASSFPQAPDYEDVKATLQPGDSEQHNPAANNQSPATATTLKLIKDAKDNAKPFSEYNAYFPQNNLQLICNDDKTMRFNVQKSVYLINDNAAPKFTGNYLPPKSKVELARIIFPDGKYIDAKPITRPGNTLIHFPVLRAGCLIMLQYEYENDADDQLYEISEEIPMQLHYPVLSSEVKITPPTKLKINCKFFGIFGLNNTTTSQATDLKYSAQNIPAIENLPYNPPIKFFQSRTMVSSIKSWKQIAATYQFLARPALTINQKTIHFVQQLTKDDTTDTQKIRRIYNYLCGLRYHSTPFGISALRPRNPAALIKEGYGDCKDKATALMVLAKALRIKSHIALVNRTSFTDKGFPSWQFNHMICYFPKLSGYPDGLWCDPTDGATMFGSLPPGDIARDALILDGEQARFLTVKAGNNNINSINHDIHISRSDAASFTGTAHITLSGLASYHLRHNLRYLSPAQKSNFIQNELNRIIPFATMNTYQLNKDYSDFNKPLTLEIKFTLPLAPSRIAINPAQNIFNAFTDKSRKYGVYINDNQPLKITHSLKVEGDNIGEQPKEFAFDLGFMSCAIKCKNSNGSWTRSINLNLSKGYFNAAEYRQIKDKLSQMTTNLISK